MLYTKIDLKGYKRLQLSQIQRIQLTPKHVLQLILGSNGSGKSSLLREISPLPSHPSQYEKDGYKHLELIHRSIPYTVINQFDGKSVRFQLMKDGVDIFQGSTTTDFRALIKKEFGITPEIQSLIDGVTKFSTMDVSKRRYWFTLLSHADYTYALSYYANLRSRIRDLQGGLNLSQNQYANELTKVLTEDEIHNIRNRCRQYKDIVRKLLELKPKIDDQLVDPKQKLIQINQTLKNQIRKTDSVIRQNTSSLIDDITESDALRIQKEYDYRIQRLDARRQDLQKTIEEEYKSPLLHNVSPSSLADLYEQRIQKTEERDALSLKRQIDILIQDPDTFHQALLAINDEWNRIVQELPEEYNSRYQHSHSQLLSEVNHKNQYELTVLQKRIHEFQQSIKDMDHAKTHKQTTCPQCQHVWYQGYSELAYTHAEGKLKELLLEETKQIECIHAGELELDEINRVLTLYEQYRQLVQKWDILKPLWFLIGEEGFLRKQQSKTIYEAVLRDIPFIIQIKRLDHSLADDQRVIDLLENQNEEKIVQQHELIKNLEAQLSSIQDQIRTNQANLNGINSYIELTQWVKQLNESIEVLLQEKESALNEAKIKLQCEHYNRLVDIFNIEISQLEHQIYKIDLQQDLIKRLKTQIIDYETQIKLLKQAEQAMSPSNGLIAKGLIGFINWFIMRMNQFVKKIWIYPLEILPIKLNEQCDLDYQFPIEIDHRFGAPDVKVGDCNQSTCEIFDLAFRIIAMECLRMNDYPLQLDEFGASFDAQHRNSAFQIVTNLTTTTNIPQIFMVSHFDQSYSGLKNADLTVLHAENIIVPQGIVVNGQTLIQ